MGPDIVKRLLYVLASLFFLSTTITAVAQDESKNPIIESIEVIAANDKPEQVVFKLNGSHTPKIFKLNGDNPRLVLDFYGVKYPSRIDRISDVGGDIIAAVRVGRHTDPQRTRVVVDIQQDSPYQYDKTFNVSNNNLVVTLVPDFEAIAGEQQATSQPQRIVVDSPKVVHTPSTAPVPPVQPESPEPVEVAQEQARDEQSDEGQAVAEVSAESPQTTLEPDQPASVADDTTGPETPTMEQEAEQTPTVQSGEQQAEQTSSMQSSEQEAEQAPSLQSAEQEAEQTSTAESAEQQAEQTPTMQPSEQEAGQQSTQIEDIKPVLLDVSFEKSINGSETVMFRLNHFYPPLVFGVEKGEPRVICHFLDASIGENIPPEIEAGGQFVSRITIAEEPDPAKVRVELVLVPTRNYDLQQLFFKEDNLFVIIVKELQNGSEVSN
jgi:hypothetical protein